MGDTEFRPGRSVKTSIDACVAHVAAGLAGILYVLALGKVAQFGCGVTASLLIFTRLAWRISSGRTLLVSVLPQRVAQMGVGLYRSCLFDFHPLQI